MRVRGRLLSTLFGRISRASATALAQLAAAIEHRLDKIARLIAIENGKVLTHCIAETRAAASECHYYSGLARAIFGRVAEIDEGVQSIFSREAVGLASIIVPWHAPSTLLIQALAPALAAGCTIVVKGAHQTASVNHLYAQFISDCAAIPDGVVNFVHGELEVSTTLCTHPEVDFISFTGSSATGRKIMASAAATRKRLSLELGGKSPAIVFADACPTSAPVGQNWGFEHRRISDDGPDDPQFVAPVGPSAHREIHYGENGPSLNEAPIE